MDKISVDFEAAKREAAQLEELASELERLLQGSYQHVLQELSWGWKGESADAYRRKAEALQGQIGRTAQDIRTVARNVRSSAQKIYEAQMRAKQLAENRSSVSGSSGMVFAPGKR